MGVLVSTILFLLLSVASSLVAILLYDLVIYDRLPGMAPRHTDTTEGSAHDVRHRDAADDDDEPPFGPLPVHP